MLLFPPFLWGTRKGLNLDAWGQVKSKLLCFRGAAPLPQLQFDPYFGLCW